MKKKEASVAQRVRNTFNANVKRKPAPKKPAYPAPRK